MIVAERMNNVPEPDRVLIIGDDMSFVPQIKRVLADMVATDVEQIVDGAQAWERLRHEDFDLIVLHWKLAGLSSLALFNRIRSDKQYAMVPVLVASNNLQQDDFRLLDEFPCSHLVELPVSGPEVAKATRAVLEEAEWYLRRRPFVERLFVQAYHDSTRIRHSIKQLLKDAPNPVPASLMVAEILMSQGHLDQAETIYRKVLSYSRDSIPALNGIGKVLYKRGKPEEAFTFLRVAWRQCEKNIERLCLLGELEIGNHDAKSAESYFRQALAIDRDHIKASAGVMICRNLHEYVRRHTAVGLPRSFASVCNSVGISLIRNEEMDRGLEQYEAALKFLGKDPVAGLVMFNMGLGFARWQRWDDAYEWFEKSARLSPPEFKKANQWVERLNRVAGKPAEDRGTLVAFEEGDEIQVVDAPLGSDSSFSVEGADIEEIAVDDSWFEDIYDDEKGA